MLVSHRKQYIYTKTQKTAGTTVESYFERWCLPEGEWEYSMDREEYVSETGVIGYRGPDRGDRRFHDHMTAAQIRKQLGGEIWNRYFKFCVIRNPFDKLVSAFHFRRKLGKLSANLPRKRSWRGSLVPQQFEPHGTTPQEQFREWIAAGARVLDRNKYLVDDQICVDFFIRYEDLAVGIQHVCQQVNVPFRPEWILNLKSEFRPGGDQLADWYDPGTIEIVSRLYGFEMNHFGYRPPKHG